MHGTDARISSAEFDAISDIASTSVPDQDSYMRVARGVSLSAGSQLEEIIHIGGGGREGVCETPEERDYDLSGGGGSPVDSLLSLLGADMDNDSSDYSSSSDEDDEDGAWLLRLAGGAGGDAALAGGRVWGANERTLVSANDSDHVVNQVNVDIAAKHKYLKVIARAVGRPFRYDAKADAGAPFAWMGWMPLPRHTVQELIKAMATPPYWGGVAAVGAAPAGPGVQAAITNMNPNLAVPADRVALFRDIAKALGSRWHAAATNKARDAHGANMVPRPLFSKWSGWDHTTNLDLLGKAVYSWQVKLRRLVPTKAAAGDGDGNHLGLTPKRLRQLHKGAMVLLDVLALQSIPELHPAHGAAVLAAGMPLAPLLAMLSKPVLRDILDVSHNTGNILPVTQVENTEWVYTDVDSPNPNTVRYTFTRRGALVAPAGALEAMPLNPPLTDRFAALAGGFPASVAALGPGLPNPHGGGGPPVAPPVAPPVVLHPPAVVGAALLPVVPVGDMPRAAAWLQNHAGVGPAPAADVQAALAGMGQHVAGLFDNVPPGLAEITARMAPANLTAKTRAWRNCFDGGFSHPTETGKLRGGQQRWTWDAHGAITDNASRGDSSYQDTLQVGLQVWRKRGDVAQRFHQAHWTAAETQLQADALDAAVDSIANIMNNPEPRGAANPHQGPHILLEAIAGLSLLAGVVPMSMLRYIEFAVHHNIHGLQDKAEDSLAAVERYWTRWIFMLENGRDLVADADTAGAWAGLMETSPVEQEFIGALADENIHFAFVKLTRHCAAAGGAAVPGRSRALNATERAFLRRSSVLVDVSTWYPTAAGVNVEKQPLGCAVAVAAGSLFQHMAQGSIQSGDPYRVWELPSTWDPPYLGAAHTLFEAGAGGAAARGMPASRLEPAPGAAQLVAAQHNTPHKAMSVDKVLLAANHCVGTTNAYVYEEDGDCTVTEDTLAVMAPRLVVLGVEPRWLRARGARAGACTPVNKMNVVAEPRALETVSTESLIGYGREAMRALAEQAGVAVQARLCVRRLGPLVMLHHLASFLNTQAKMAILKTSVGMGTAMSLTSWYHQEFKYQRCFAIPTKDARHVSGYADMGANEEHKMYDRASAVFPDPVPLGAPAAGGGGAPDNFAGALDNLTGLGQLPFAVPSFGSVDNNKVLQTEKSSRQRHHEKRMWAAWERVAAPPDDVPHEVQRREAVTKPDRVSQQMRRNLQIHGVPGALAYRAALSRQPYMMRPFPTHKALATLLDGWAAKSLFHPTQIDHLRRGLAFV